MTLLEIAVAMPIVLVAMGMLVQILSVGIGLRRTARESRLANARAQDVLEEMRNENYRDIVRLYNADPFDDPMGPGTAPGSTFSVDGLTTLEATPLGQVILPTLNTGTEVVPVWETREDMALDDLSLPRDLNGDILIDDQDHSDDYTILPVLVRLQWQSPSGPRTYELQTLLTEVAF